MVLSQPLRWSAETSIPILSQCQCESQQRIQRKGAITRHWKAGSLTHTEYGTKITLPPQSRWHPALKHGARCHVAQSIAKALLWRARRALAEADHDHNLQAKRLCTTAYLLTLVWARNGFSLGIGISDAAGGGEVVTGPAGDAFLRESSEASLANEPTENRAGLEDFGEEMSPLAPPEDERTAEASTTSTGQNALQDMSVDDDFGEPVLFNLIREQEELPSDDLHDELPEIRDILRQYGPAAHANVSDPSPLTTFSAVPSRISLRATTYDGKSVLLKRKPRQYLSVLNKTNVSRERMGSLLDVPIHRLLDELSLNTANKIIQVDAQAHGPSAALPSEDAETTLWVDRYRPRRFVDLVGDDRVHREVMSWVKEWDFCVFGKSKGKKRARDEDNPDDYRRPREKLLLISGPPGLGKTTLAHVVAKQAGYVVFEVNASDARSAQVVDDVIQPALEAGKHIKKNKPYLVVIDEIDGATGGSESSTGFIQKLIQLTFDRPGRKKGRKREPEETRPLLRPIICICNDLYHSSLTKLRQHARIIRVGRCNDLHVVNRLRDICEIEGLRADSRALTALVGVAQGDLRGCLNTLQASQLIKARNETVTETVVRRATVGMKAADVSQTAVLNDLFLPMSRKRAKELGIGEEEESRYIGRLSQEVERSGALDKIAIGCFEHYTNLRHHDGNFSRYLKANEWLSIYDLMSGEMRSEREYALMEYLPFTLVPFYPLFQERGASKVERPKADWENYTRTKLNEEIYRSLATCLRTAGTRCEGAYRHLASEDVLRLEVAPMINRIISPPLRPVNSQVIRPEERTVLERLVDIMVSLELRFMQEKSEDGQLVYRLEPPVDVFVTYDGKRAPDLAVSRYAVRHLVAAEIDARLVNRQAEALEKSKGGARSFFSKKRNTVEVAEEEAVAPGDGKLLAGESERGVFKRARRDDKVEEKVPTDFFGRPIVPKKGNRKPSSSRKVPMKRAAVIYRFNEGNSAAVRKPVKVAAFL
ncbi:hypothetical protein NM688_g5019 [Phlebia brevispora]|uniref:Uncharacterized protein n=1 Tax=Phlebia brevispora TaxID=194682 RepID=A0ACC1T1F4_9APHY|nr:hypothetical protein NM688_g5019 [Phlebia brevispora]